MANSVLFSNKVDGSTMTADSEAGAYPVSALNTQNPARTWRSDDVAAAYHLVVDLGSAIEIDTVALANVNLTSSATVTIEGNATDSWGAPSFGPETISVAALAYSIPHTDLLHKLSSAQTYQFFRITINDATNPAGFYEVGELWLGDREEFDVGQDFQTDQDQDFPDPNIVNETEYGHQWVYVREVGDIRTFNLEWTAVTSATRDVLRVMERTTKKSGYPFWFVPDISTVPVQGFFVRMAGPFGISQTSPIAYSVRLAMAELPRGRSLET